MKKLLSSFGILSILGAATIASAAMMMKPNIVPAGSATWNAVPGVKGLTVAVLYGTPSKAGTGYFTERYKATSDVTFPVHTHANTEAVTVLSGTLMFGIGSSPNWSSATALTAGGFVGIPAGVAHYGRLKAGSIIEVSGIAPDTMIPVKTQNSSM